MQQSQTIGLIDSQYGFANEELQWYLSEFALIQYRVRIEIEYLIELSTLSLPWLIPIDETLAESLREIYQLFDIKDAKRVKDIERKLNHDVKAVEYLVKEKLRELGLGDIEEFVHMGLTSQDINNTAVPLSIFDAIDVSFLSAADSLITSVKETDYLWLHERHKQQFIQMLEREISLLQKLPRKWKFGWATGWYNAMKAAYPHIDWPKFWDSFLERLWLARQQFTTQIEHYDLLMQQFAIFKRIAVLMKRFWENIFQCPTDVVSHKLFYGNIQMAIGYCDFFIQKVPISRLQRDLTDSTVSRNFWNPIAHILSAMNQMKSILWVRSQVQVWSDKDNELDPLMAISPIDGRYRKRSTESLSAYFSKESLEEKENPSEMIGLSMKEAILPRIIKVRDLIFEKAQEYKDIPMLALTHWQAATPTDLWVQMMVFVERLDDMLHLIETDQLSHTQIFDMLVSMNSILINFCRDIWTYIQMNYFTQKIKEWEVGSSAMPHKVNPIDFENAEGNLWLASSLLLSIWERFQNSFDAPNTFDVQHVGTPLAHIFIALDSLTKWLWKIQLNTWVIAQHLENNPMIISEAIQTILKREWITDAYEKLLQLTRVKWWVTLEQIHEFILTLDIPETVKTELRAITPTTYSGQYPHY